MDRLVRIYRQAQRRGDLVVMRICLSRGGVVLLALVEQASR